MTGRLSGADAKRLFAEQTDEINRLSRAEGPDPEAAADLADMLAEHERECEALMRKRDIVDGEATVR